MDAYTAAAPDRGFEAVVIGGSAGSLAVVQTLLAGLNEDFEPPVVVLMHSRSADTEDAVWLLGRHSRLPVCEAREREPVTPGQVYVAPGDYHLLVERDRHFSISLDPRVCYARPSIDVLFDSAAETWRERLIACVLTGANNDGAAGAARVRELGGHVLVQDPASAEAATMPDAALAHAHWVGPPADMAAQLNRLAKATA